MSFCFFEFLLLTYPAMAVTSTPSATPTDLEDKIKSLVKDKLEITEIEKQRGSARSQNNKRIPSRNR